MGASESKLVFKQGIFKLSERKDIPADDPYWAGFWELPESAEDVFSLFSLADIRRIRDESLNNLETLILAVSSRLYVLRHTPTFPNFVDAPERDALNCIRILTRLLPFIYEADHLNDWEDQFFWGGRRTRTKRSAAAARVVFDGSASQDAATDNEGDFEDAIPLGEELIDTLLALLFFSEFTLPKTTNGNKVSLAIWQSGVGCNSPVGTSKEYENNRMEILRLLLTLASKSMYTPANILPVQGIKAITYMATIDDKQQVLTLLCSLLNTTLKYNSAAWKVPYDYVMFKDPKHMFVTYSLQLLLVLVLYPIPEQSNGAIPKNSFRHFLGRLHRPQDFQFLVDGMTRILNQPLQASVAYLPGSQKSLSWAPEIIMLFWEVLQCNKRFRSFIVDTDRAHDFMILVLYYATENKDDISKQGIVRMCVFILQTLSVEATFGARLNTPFQGQETLPLIVRIPNFRGTYADFLITSVYNLITGSKGKLDAIYPALLAIINNIAPHLHNLSSSAGTKVLQLFTTMSSPTFLLANESNHHLILSLLEAINAIIEHQYTTNATFIFQILRAHQQFYALRDFAVEGGQTELERNAQLRKELAEDPSRLMYSQSRNVSTESLRSPMRARGPPLSNVPEDSSTFAIGDDDDSDDEIRPVATPSSRTSKDISRRTSMADSVDDAVPLQTRGLSEKARGKMPAHQLSFVRHSSNASLSSMAIASYRQTGSFEPDAAWIDTWLPELPLHTVQSLLDQLLPQLPPQGSSGAITQALDIIRKSKLERIEASPVRVRLFEWSPLSLGWYESLLWGFIFSAEVNLSKGTAGAWKGTNIKLFRVQEAVIQSPTLMAPRGAVDAVGTTLVQKLGSFGFRGALAAAEQRISQSTATREV